MFLLIIVTRLILFWKNSRLRWSMMKFYLLPIVHSGKFQFFNTFLPFYNNDLKHILRRFLHLRIILYPSELTERKLKLKIFDIKELTHFVWSNNNTAVSPIVRYTGVLVCTVNLWFEVTQLTRSILIYWSIIRLSEKGSHICQGLGSLKITGKGVVLLWVDLVLNLNSDWSCEPVSASVMWCHKTLQCCPPRQKEQR